MHLWIKNKNKTKQKSGYVSWENRGFKSSSSVVSNIKSLFAMIKIYSTLLIYHKWFLFIQYLTTLKSQNAWSELCGRVRLHNYWTWRFPGNLTDGASAREDGRNDKQELPRLTFALAQFAIKCRKQTRCFLIRGTTNLSTKVRVQPPADGTDNPFTIMEKLPKLPGKKEVV